MICVICVTRGVHSLASDHHKKKKKRPSLPSDADWSLQSDGVPDSRMSSSSSFSLFFGGGAFRARVRCDALPDNADERSHLFGLRTDNIVPPKGELDQLTADIPPPFIRSNGSRDLFVN